MRKRLPVFAPPSPSALKACEMFLAVVYDDRHQYNDLKQRWGCGYMINLSGFDASYLGGGCYKDSFLLAGNGEAWVLKGPRRHTGYDDPSSFRERSSEWRVYLQAPPKVRERMIPTINFRDKLLIQPKVEPLHQTLNALGTADEAHRLQRAARRFDSAMRKMGYGDMHFGNICLVQGMIMAFDFGGV